MSWPLETMCSSGGFFAPATSRSPVSADAPIAPVSDSADAVGASLRPVRAATECCAESIAWAIAVHHSGPSPPIARSRSTRGLPPATGHSKLASTGLIVHLVSGGSRKAPFERTRASSSKKVSIGSVVSTANRRVKTAESTPVPPRLSQPLRSSSPSATSCSLGTNAFWVKAVSRWPSEAPPASAARRVPPAAPPAAPGGGAENCASRSRTDILLAAAFTDRGSHGAAVFIEIFCRVATGRVNRRRV